MERTINGITYVSAAEAAEYLATTQLKVLMFLKKKYLIGTEIDGEWFVTRESLECCKEHGRDMKTEMGCKSYCTSGGCGCRE